jgi:hypothetical protein
MLFDQYWPLVELRHRQHCLIRAFPLNQVTGPWARLVRGLKDYHFVLSAFSKNLALEGRRVKLTRALANPAVSLGDGGRANNSPEVSPVWGSSPIPKATICPRRSPGGNRRRLSPDTAGCADRRF